MTRPVEYLGLDDLIELSILLMGEPAPIRDVGLLGAAAARPAATAFGEEAYGSVWLKAAALLQSIAKNHALIDGNKRLAWLATAVFLDLNGEDPTVLTNDAVYDLIIGIAAGGFEVEEIAEQLQSAHDAPNS